MTVGIEGLRVRFEGASGGTCGCRVRAKSDRGRSNMPGKIDIAVGIQSERIIKPQESLPVESVPVLAKTISVAGVVGSAPKLASLETATILLPKVP